MSQAGRWVGHMWDGFLWEWNKGPERDNLKGGSPKRPCADCVQGKAEPNRRPCGRYVGIRNRDTGRVEE